MINRRQFFISGFYCIVIGFQPSKGLASFEIILTEKEWREILSPAQFAILRDWKTERPFSNSLYGEKSDLLKENRPGIYCCAGCGLELYLSEKKYDSGTGWPSFWQAISGNVGYRDDRHFFKVLIEVHCSRCGGHLGHVFDDGPKPTGKRHCINALALIFKEAQ